MFMLSSESLRCNYEWMPFLGATKFETRHYDIVSPEAGDPPTEELA